MAWSFWIWESAAVRELCPWLGKTFRPTHSTMARQEKLLPIGRASFQELSACVLKALNELAAAHECEPLDAHCCRLVGLRPDPPSTHRSEVAALQSEMASVKALLWTSKITSRRESSRQAGPDLGPGGGSIPSPSFERPPLSLGDDMEKCGEGESDPPGFAVKAVKSDLMDVTPTSSKEDLQEEVVYQITLQQASDGDEREKSLRLSFPLEWRPSGRLGW